MDDEDDFSCSPTPGQVDDVDLDFAEDQRRWTSLELESFLLGLGLVGVGVELEMSDDEAIE